MRIHDQKLCNMARALSLSVFIALKGTIFYILFAITAVDVVPSCGHKKVTPYIMHSADYILLLVL